MRVLDIEAIAVPDASYDCVVCSHVLEHVDDAKALCEIYRVLKPGGVALIMLPVIEGWATTYENPHVTSPEDQEAPLRAGGPCPLLRRRCPESHQGRRIRA